MAQSTIYHAWNKRRREAWPDAKHSAYSSEQVIDIAKGHELVASWDLNFIRDSVERHHAFDTGDEEK